MKRILILALCIALLPGCLASFGVQVGNTSAPATQPSVGPGGSFSSTGVSARYSDGSVFGAIIAVGVLGTLFGGGQRSEPELDASRPVQEQDCTRALQAPEANLRCK